MKLNEVKSFSDLLLIAKNNEYFILETNKIIKFEQILNSYIEFLKKEILINNNELIFIETKCHNLENEINFVKKNEIIKEIYKNNKLKEVQKYLTNINEINSVFKNIFKKLRNNIFLNNILNQYDENFNKQEKNISDNKQLIEKIINTVFNQENLIKINEICLLKGKSPHLER